VWISTRIAAVGRQSGGLVQLFAFLGFACVAFIASGIVFVLDMRGSLE
jgi:hypothetical protein